MCSNRDCGNTQGNSLAFLDFFFSSCGILSCLSLVLLFGNLLLLYADNNGIRKTMRFPLQHDCVNGVIAGR